MSDNSYRTSVSQDTTPAQEQVAQPEKGSVSEVTVEPPFTSYEIDKGKPFLVDHYELGSLWNETDMYSNGYKDEVTSINTYLEHLINTGELNNTLESVRGKLKSIEKMINIPKDARTAVRVGQVAAYVDFLLKSDNIKKDSAKYGMR